MPAPLHGGGGPGARKRRRTDGAQAFHKEADRMATSARRTAELIAARKVATSGAETVMIRDAPFACTVKPAPSGPSRASTAIADATAAATRWSAQSNAMSAV